MLKHGLEEINLNNPIENKIPQIIEYFVKFYGEKYRERITQRINDTVFVFVDKSSVNRNSDINRHFDGVHKKLMNVFREKIKTSTNATFIENDNLGYFTAPQLDSLEEWKSKIEKDDIENVTNFLKHFDRNLDSNKILSVLKGKNANQIYDFLDKINTIYKEEIKDDLHYLESERVKYLDFSKELKGLSYLERMYNEEANNVLYKNLLQNFNLQINEENRRKFNEFADMYRDFVYKNPKFITEYDIDRLLPFFEFIDKSSETESNQPSFCDYLKNKSFIEKLVPDRLKQQLSEIERQKQKELSPILSGKSENLSKIYTGEFMQEDIILSHITSFINFASSEKTAAFVLPAPSYTSKKQSTVCVLGSYFQLYDSHIIHELNHIIETDYVVENGTIKNKCGFDYESISVANGSKTSHTDCELLNEIINDYLSKKVLALMNEDGFTIGHESDKTTSYSKAFPLLAPFIEENLSEIIDARMSSKPMQFAEKIGKENLTKLSKIVSDYLEILKVFPLYYAEANIRNTFNIEGEIDFFSFQPDNRLSINTNDILKCCFEARLIMDKIKEQKCETSFKNDDENETY